MSRSLDLCWRSGGLSLNCPCCQIKWLYILSRGLIEILKVVFMIFLNQSVGYWLHWINFVNIWGKLFPLATLRTN